MDQQSHKAWTRSSPQLMVENPAKWREGPQQITRLVQDGPPQLMVENPGKWKEGPQQITRLVQDGPPQLMVENPGKWQEGPHWFLRTTNKTAPLGATKYWKRKFQSLLLLLLFLVLDSFYFVLFCIINHGGQLIHERSKISLFLAWKMGVDLYTNRFIHEKIRYVILEELRNWSLTTKSPRWITFFSQVI